MTPSGDIPQAGSGEADDFRADARLRSGRFGRHKRYSSLLSDSSVDEDGVASADASRHGSRASLPTGQRRSQSQGDEPENSSGTFKKFK